MGTQNMTTLKDSVLINRSPEAVFEWFAHFAENYRDWHKDHVLAKDPPRNNIGNFLDCTPQFSHSSSLINL